MTHQPAMPSDVPLADIPWESPSLRAEDMPLPPTFRDVLAHGTVGHTYTLCGWIRSHRSSKNVSFLALSDGSTAELFQVVLDHGHPEFQALQPRLTTGASIKITGPLTDSPAPGQRVELQAQQIELLGASAPETYPLQKKGHSLEFLRSMAHLRPRSHTFGAVFRIRSQLALATHGFFSRHGFAHVHTPIITASDCEGAGEAFEVIAHSKHSSDAAAPRLFFNRPAMLTVSGQLNGEALAYGLGRIYTFGPTFRAENSNTVRHLSEFWMVEPEMAFGDLQSNMVLAQAYLKAMVASVLHHNPQDLAFLQKHFDATLQGTLEGVLAQPFEHITYSQAIALLQKSQQDFEFKPQWGRDLQAEHERFLVEIYFKKPTIVTDYPSQLKAFYMYQNPDGSTVAAMDVLIPRLGEIIGGSQREHRIDRLEVRLRQAGMAVENYQWYLDLHRYGAAPHAGFGLGFERLVMFCTGMTNIRDVIPFPRSPGCASF